MAGPGGGANADDNCAEILERRAAMVAGFAALPGWCLLGCGACFAYAEHPQARPSDQLAP
ncbi:MAG: hypothetical protein H5U19_12620 [Rhodobacteraceae bacterium]|nr:hypothetical protein [Paracoccaceae bacterium]